MKQRKITSWFLAACVVLLTIAFTACNGKKKDAGTASSSKGPVQVTVWEMYGPDRNINKIVDAYNKSQNEVYVVDEFIPSHTELMQKLQVASAAGSGLPDAVLIDMFYAPMINDLVGLVDLNPYLADDPTISADDFYDDLREFSNINGKQISLHAYANNNILFYNKALFKAAGLDPNKPPETWDKMVQYAQAMTKDGQWGYLCTAFFDSYYETVSWQYQMFAWQNGAEMWDSKWQPTFDTPEGVEALQFMMDLLYKYQVGTVAPPEGAFEQGKVGMILNGTWMGRDYEAALGDDLAAAPLPYKKTPASNAGGEHWMILPSAKKREDAAWKFISHMLTEAVVTEICANGGQVPTRKSIADSVAFQQFANQHPAIKTSMETMNVSRMRAASPRYGAASEAMSVPIQQALFNKISAQEAITAASAAFAKAINGQ